MSLSHSRSHPMSRDEWLTVSHPRGPFDHKKNVAIAFSLMKKRKRDHSPFSRPNRFHGRFSRFSRFSRGFSGLHFREGRAKRIERVGGRKPAELATFGADSQFCSNSTYWSTCEHVARLGVCGFERQLPNIFINIHSILKWSS